MTATLPLAQPATPARRVMAAVRIAAGLGLLAFAFRKVDFAEVLAVLSPVLALAIGVGTALLVATAWLQALRWRRIARALHVPLGFAAALRSTLVSYFLLTVTPSTVVADGARMLAARRSGGSWTLAAQSVVIDRIFGLLALVALGVLSLPVIRFEAPSLFWPLGVPILLLGLGTVAVVLAPGLSLPRRWLRARSVRRWAGLMRGFRATLTARPELAASAGLSLLITLVSAAVFWMLAAASGARADPAAIVIVFPAMMLVSVLPVSINGWGVRELSAVSIYPWLGTPEAPAMAASLAYGLALLLAGCLSLAAASLPGVRPGAAPPDSRS